MSEQSKIYSLYESMNQSGIAYDQQRNKNSYKYTPAQGKPSFTKDAIPTVSSVKMKGAAYTPNGISDEETVYVPGYAKMRPEQLKESIKKYIFEINEALKSGKYEKISNMADILNLFSTTYSKYLKSIEK